jgi:cell division protein FtsN
MTTQTNPPPWSQRGGTLIGLVIGLLMGLGMALAVAVYVTKVPVPFVDRNLSRNPAQDAAETERNKGWNPNAMLSGRSATAPPPAAMPPADTDGAIVVPPADGQPLPKPGAIGSSSEVPGADLLGDLAKARMDNPTTQSAAVKPVPMPASGPGADPFLYFVQAGAFKSAEDAEAQRAKLAMLGIESLVSEREQAGHTVHRVRAGPFNQKALADLTREQLEANGTEATLVRVQR